MTAPRAHCIITPLRDRSAAAGLIETLEGFVVSATS